MNLFLVNGALAVGFMFVAETFSLGGLAAGFAVGYAALWLMRPLFPRQRYFWRVPTLLRLLGFFVRALLVSNLRVLWDVVTPGNINRPGIVRLPLDARTDLEVMLTANLISLTPGTLSIDVSPDRRYLYVHVMFLDDIDATRRELKEGLERRVLEVLR